MKKSLMILFHAGFWFAYLIFVAIIMFASLQGIDIPPEDYRYYISFVTGAAIVPSIISFYTHYYYLLPKYLEKRKLFLSAIFSILFSLLAVSLGFFTVYLTSSEAFNCIQTCTPYALTATFVLSTIFGGIALVLRGFLKWYQELKFKEELIKKNHHMEMALVKSQLDPHFLFNTLNNIDVIISKDHEEASLYLNKLSDIMRFMLYETKTAVIPLNKELEYIEKYIQLQKIRTANNNYVKYEVQGAPNKKKVAPMVFIPFIENAFKHSVNKKIDEAVSISINIEDQAINFKCQNIFEQYKTTQNGYNGLGNELIQRRLQLLYPNKHTLKINHEADKYSVELTIQHGAI